MKFVKNLSYLLNRQCIRAFKINKNGCRLCGHYSPARQAEAVSAQAVFRHIGLARELTGCTEKNVIKALAEVPELQLMSEEEVTRRYERIKELNVTEKHGRQIILVALKPLVVTNRVMSCIELGFYSHRITVSVIKNYVTLTKKTVTRLKEKRYIGQETDVISRLAKYAQIDPEALPENLTENCSVADIKMAVHKELLKKSVGASDEEVSENLPYMKFIRNKSVRMLLKSIDVYENLLKIPKHRILTTYYMLVTDPEKPAKFLKEIKSIGGVDILDLIYIFPQIANTTPENARAIIRHFKEYGVPEEQVVKVPNILGFNQATVKERLKRFKSSKYFGCYRKHPRLTKIICVLPQITRALDILERHNLKVSSISNLSRRVHFEKYLNDGWIKLNGVDLVHFIQGEFGKSPPEIRSSLKKNSFWYHASIMDLYLNLTLLRSSYSMDEIWRNILVLFYSHERLKLELHQLDSHESDYLELLKDESTGCIRQEYRLKLLLYYLERPTHFTGEGIYLTQTSDEDVVVDDPRARNLADSRDQGRSQDGAKVGSWPPFLRLIIVTDGPRKRMYNMNQLGLDFFHEHHTSIPVGNMEVKNG